MLPNIPLTRISGATENIQDYANKVLLIVNVASHCGFTSQYRELQSLHEEFKDRGLVVMGFPCNQFGNQEPGSSQEIAQFCQTNYKITFPIFQKIEVNGANTHSLFEYLKKNAPGILGTEAIKWNFTKFLVNREGQVVNRYASASTPESISSDIKKLL